MNWKHWTALSYGIAVLAYAGWKGKATAISQITYFNGKGEVVVPIAVRTMEEATNLGAARYYVSSDGSQQIDLFEHVQYVYNWSNAFQVIFFGVALVLLVVLIRFLIHQIENEPKRQVR